MVPNRTSLVIGGSGFVGRNLVPALLERGDTVRVISRRPVPSDLFPSEGRVQTIVGDYGDTTNLSSCLEGVQQVFHLASSTQPKSSNDDMMFDIQSNLIASVQLLKEMSRRPSVRVIFVSSGGTVYGVPAETPITEQHSTVPLCSYGIVKVAIENYLHLFGSLHGLDYRILRVSNPFGPEQHLNRSQGVIGNFIHQLGAGEKLQVWGDGSVVRDYIYITDVIRSLLLASVYEGAGRVFNIGSGIGRQLLEVIAIISKVMGKRPEIEFMPSRRFDIPVNVLDISAAREQLKWSPEVSLEEGVRRLASIRNQ